MIGVIKYFLEAISLSLLPTVGTREYSHPDFLDWEEINTQETEVSHL